MAYSYRTALGFCRSSMALQMRSAMNFFVFVGVLHLTFAMYRLLRTVSTNDVDGFFVVVGPPITDQGDPPSVRTSRFGLGFPRRLSTVSRSEILDRYYGHQFVLPPFLHFFEGEEPFCGKRHPEGAS